MNNLSEKEIGERLRIARENAQITQNVSAQEIGVARTTIVAIEQGLRKIRIDELQKLASLYKTTVNALLRAEAVTINISPSFRKSKNANIEDVCEAVKLLENLVRAEVELENALGVKKRTNYPMEERIIPTSKSSLKRLAETTAESLRNTLGLSSSPVLDILSILDANLGIRVYLRPIKGNISGIYAYNSAIGACMLINSNHPAKRQRLTGIHELGHFMSNRDSQHIIYKEIDSSKLENYADFFCRAFLMPEGLVTKKFLEITEGQSHLTRRHIILLADFFKVSREAITKRLEELLLVKKGIWDWFQNNGGITDHQEEIVLGKKPERYLDEIASTDKIPPRILLLAYQAWKNDLYSEGQLANLLILSRHEMREILCNLESEENSNDLFRFPR